MGFTSYSTDDRYTRSVDMGYQTKDVSAIFTQQNLRQIHESMDPKNVEIRECRDSETHPNSFPIILGLDETGSMSHIPHELIKDGLPTLMGTLIENNINDASLCFVAFGDHICDTYPLQIAQFESGDAELDMWLTRSYLEGNGGGNGGESYHLVWDFAANKTATDAWDKRKQKGVLITIGDEPVLDNLTKSAVQGLYGKSHHEATQTVTQLLERAKERWNVYHIHINHTRGSDYATDGWKRILGENCIVLTSHKDIPKTIANIVLKHIDTSPQKSVVSEILKPKESKNETVVDSPVML